MKKNYLVIGGDKRIVQLANMIAKNNNVYAIAQEDCEDHINSVKQIKTLEELHLKKEIDYIILPVVSSRDEVHIDAPLSNSKIKISDIIKVLSSKTIILAGNPSDKLIKFFENTNTKVIDYFDNEELIMKNAVATVEGALQVLIKETPKTIFRQKCLISGYGRIGSIMATYLKSLNAQVSIFARNNKQIATAKSNGINAYNLNMLSEKIKDYDIIVNTIPSMIFNDKILDKSNPDVFILDLASPPGGVDFEHAKKINRKNRWELLIPGRMSPISSAQYIYESIETIIKEGVDSFGKNNKKN